MLVFLLVAFFSYFNISRYILTLDNLCIRKGKKLRNHFRKYDLMVVKNCCPVGLVISFG